MAAVASSSHLHLHLNHLIINNDNNSESAQATKTSTSQPLQAKQLGKLWEQALQQPITFLMSSNQPNMNQIPYPPINQPHPPPPAHSICCSNQISSGLSNSTQSTSSGPSQSSTLATQVATSWIRPQPIGPGFHNTGNTCFLNATLQALVHTPALVIGLMDRDEHSPESCGLARNKKFCALCRMYRLVNMCFDRASFQEHAIEPSPINRALSKFAPTMRGGRQEDAHEFLRLLVEAMQNGALHGRVGKAKQKQKESTFVHRMFGGKLRSRVVCEHCNTPSDTFDNFLDLSLDISQANSVTSALKAYHKFDRLRGANQYKCDNCKCLRDAKKSMSVYSAPPILTLHLKRFNFRGRKINKRVNFEDSLDLKPAMSNEADVTGYKLYAVVCHRGQSNKSGHYYAHIKASNGKWYVADDSTIELISDPRAVLANEHAYILFYARDRENLLSAAISSNCQSHTGLDGGFAHGSFSKRKPLASDSPSHFYVANRVSENTSIPSSENANKRVKMASTHCSKTPTNQFIGSTNHQPILPSFKFKDTKPSDPSGLRASLLAPNTSLKELNIQSGGVSPSKPSLPHLVPNSKGEDKLADDEVEKPMSEMKKKHYRKPKAKPRKLVNIAGTQVTQVLGFRPRLITG